MTGVEVVAPNHPRLAVCKKLLVWSLVTSAYDLIVMQLVSVVNSDYNHLVCNVINQNVAVLQNNQSKLCTHFSLNRSRSYKCTKHFGVGGGTLNYYIELLH